MKWELNRRTMQMEPKKKTGVEITARQGGIMVEDFDKNIQFLINYGTNKISHCIGISPDNLHVFDNRKARQIADKVKRFGTMRSIDEKFFDWMTYSINHANGSYHVKHIDEI